MVNIRSANDIILSLVDYFKVVLPNADTKEGTVVRDLMIDAPSSVISLLYDELAKISNIQSIRLVSGSDLDRLAQNYGLTRKVSTKSSGIALLTFSSIPATFSVNVGDLITASSGSSFSVVNGITVSPSNSNLYKSIATKYGNNLSFLGITDQYAVEVTAQSSTPGSAGNIATYALNQTNIQGVSNITNIFSFSGGSDIEDDSTFRNRVLAIFSGSNIGTALGYKNTALTNASVIDAVVISPGDPLMTRDGTQVKTNSDGTSTIVSEGSGGKVDVVILGSNLTQSVDSFIYNDLSNSNDPTNVKNIIVLGQIPGDENKTVTQKRVDEIAAGTLPSQPVQDINQVSGSLSGSNYVEKTVDSLGRISGNYEIIKDTGVYAGSPFGFDKFHWISNKISLFTEDRVKSKFNGQDSTTFTDIIDIPNATQNISITNENSNVSSSDRSVIQLLHTPANNVTRVFNVNTGESYLITNQNINSDTGTNTVGQIKISGNTLPAISDTLQVDYTWIRSYDPYIDYDGRELNNNIRPINDSIDWGMSNAIRSEFVQFTINSSNALLVGNTKHPITSINYCNLYSEAFGSVFTLESGLFINRKAIQINNLSSAILNISSIVVENSNIEVFNTATADGLFTNSTVIFGANTTYNCLIILPSDTIANNEDYVDIIFNTNDLFNKINSTGSFSSNQITIPSANFGSMTNVVLNVSYIANINDILSTSISSLPLGKISNSFSTVASIATVNNNLTNCLIRENQTIQQNLFNQFFIDLNLSASDFNIISSQIQCVIRLSDGVDLWNSDNVGILITDSVNGNYQIIFSGYNNPVVGDNVVVLYYADDIKRSQPFTFKNNIISRDIQQLQYDYNLKKYFAPLHSFISESNLQYQIIDPTTNIILLSGSDGYIISNGNSATFYDASISSINNITYKKIKLLNAQYPNNNGIYNINNLINNSITIEYNINELNTNNISVIRLADDLELWNSNGVIDLINNRLIFSNSNILASGDEIVVINYEFTNLKQSPTKIIASVNDQINNAGTLTFNGTTLTKVIDAIIPITSTGSLKINFLNAIKNQLGLTTSSLPPGISIARLVKADKVSITTGNQVLSVISSYDVKGNFIKDNSLYSNESYIDNSLLSTECVLPSTINNITNAPVIGDTIRATFYFYTTNDFENITFTRNGTLYSNKNFVSLNKIFVSSGFNSSLSTKFTFSYFNQPITGSRYSVFYDYLAPKPNERISIYFNYNKLIGDTTFTIEKSRPINADVLVRAAKQILIDITMNIVLTSDYVASNSGNIVVQNVIDALSASINTNSLGTTLDSSDLIPVAQAVSGVDRSRILYFNIDGVAGQVLSIVAQKDQYFIANNVIVNIETR